MKKFLQWLLALLVVVAVGCLQPLDRTPYLSAAYHQETLRRWESGAAAHASTNGPVRAGWAKVKLTPTLGVDDEPGAGRFQAVPLAGYGARKGRPATGVADDVWVKALALEVGGRRVVWVALDALIVPWEVADAACRELSVQPGLRREEVYLGATHTHSSLGGWGEGFVPEMFAGPFQPGTRTWMSRCMVDAARGAVSNLAPATVAMGGLEAPEWVRNRLVGTAGRTDGHLPLMAVRRADGATAVLGAFAAHATLLGADNMQFDRDYPGAWASVVEKATGGMALFMAGAVGSQSVQGGGGTGRERVERVGRALGERTLEALGRMTFRGTTRLGAVGVEVALPSLHLRLTEGLRVRPWLSRHVVPVRPTTFVQAVRVGDATWLSMPCDFSGELAAGLREEARARGRQLAVTSFNGDYVGYVIPGKYYHLGGYEPRVMSFHGPTMGDYLEDWGRRLGWGWE
ncbi:MAG: neutral/alkaline non-lysosomal ceramidase N-terminal domain-containing protein [Verrucomicrobiota bacterium]